MGQLKKWTKMQRDQVVILRKTGLSWPKVSQQLGIPRSTCRVIWVEDSDGNTSLPIPDDLVENARVLKLVPNPRLMLIEFEDREGVARCVKRPEGNHPVKSLVRVKRVDDDLYRIA